ncbi:hypothetical protein [Microlunatus elymi]|uniref:hypothetical protein n=1 Tax=Microlunatus elymi TaxID=2596828 RepID=UPI00143D0F3E|nr:hypothetical protein [Microlunatus elymi]
MATLLARTEPTKVPTSPAVGDPIRISDDASMTTALQRLADGSSFAIDLVADPERPSGWIVVSVRPGEE